MSSRALSLATMLVVFVFAGDARAQNLEAGKSAAQMFSGNCAACHKGVRGLLRTVPPGSLPGFLRQHYTTGPDMAGMLSTYLISRGATDQRYRVERPGSHPSDVRSEPRQAERQGRKPLPQAAQPAPSGQNEAQAGKDRYGRRIVRPAVENPETARPASEEASEQDRRKLRDKKKLSKRGKPAPEESTKAGVAGQGASPQDAATKPEMAKPEPSDVTRAKKEETVTEETAKGETPKAESPKAESDKKEAVEKQPALEQAAKPQAVKPDAPKPDPAQSENDKASRSETGEPGVGKFDAKSEAKKSSPSETSKGDSTPTVAAPIGEPKAVPLRADPVPAVTPAPKVGEGDGRSPSEAAISTPAPVSADSLAAPSRSTSAEPTKSASPETKPASPPLEPAASSSVPPLAPDR